MPSAAPGTRFCLAPASAAFTAGGVEMIAGDWKHRKHRFMVISDLPALLSDFLREHKKKIALKQWSTLDNFRAQENRETEKGSQELLHRTENGTRMLTLITSCPERQDARSAVRFYNKCAHFAILEKKSGAFSLTASCRARGTLRRYAFNDGRTRDQAP